MRRNERMLRAKIDAVLASTCPTLKPMCALYQKTSGRRIEAMPSAKARGKSAAGKRPGKRAAGKKTAPRPTAARTAAAGAAKTADKPAQRDDRGKRLLDLVVMLLGARQPVPYREIRAQFKAYRTAQEEAGLRAFERDKADLLELGVPLR